MFHAFLTYKNDTEKTIESVNKELFDIIVSGLKGERQGSIAQSYVIVGSQGSGKTSLLNRIASAVHKIKSCDYIPVLIDGKTLFSNDDIWRQCKGKPSKQRTILLVDNMNYYFNRVSQDLQYELRGILNAPGAPILIASSTEVLPAFSKYDSAFYDGLRVLYIKPVSNSTIKELIKGFVDYERYNHIMQYLPKTIRSVKMVKNIIGNSNDERSDIVALVDLMSDFYQNIYDSCLPKVQKILMALSEHENGLALLGLREKLLLTGAELSPYLNKMIAQGIIVKKSTTKKDGIYSIADPLFMQWIQSTSRSAAEYFSSCTLEESGLYAAEDVDLM